MQKLHRSLSRSLNWIQKSVLKLLVSQGWNKELTKMPQESFSTAPILTSHTLFHTFQTQSQEAWGSRDSGPLPNDLLRTGWAPPILAIQPHWTELLFSLHFNKLFIQGSDSLIFKTFPEFYRHLQMCCSRLTRMWGIFFSLNNRLLPSPAIQLMHVFVSISFLLCRISHLTFDKKQ